jgi:hypothetical protein
VLNRCGCARRLRFSGNMDAIGIRLQGGERTGADKEGQ